MNDKELKKYIQTGFKKMKEINKHLRYYFDAYYIYGDGIIYGITDKDSVERIAFVNPDDVSQYRYSGVTSEKLYDEIKDARQTRITVLNSENKIEIVTLQDDDKKNNDEDIHVTIDKLYNIKFGDEDVYLGNEILPKFYKKLHLFISQMNIFDEDKYMYLEQSVIDSLLQKRPVTITHRDVRFRFTKTLFPELNKDSVIQLGLLDYREEGKRFIIFKDKPNEVVTVYSLVAVIDL